MAKFLSEEWGNAVREALNGNDNVKNAAKGVQLTIQQVVTGVPDSGEAKYWSQFSDGSINGGTGEAPNPDVTITQDYDTAAALNRGELNPQAAFMQGKLKVTGNMGKLLQHQGVLQAIGPIMAAVPTEY
jgi:putative sterol carrier protein